MDKFFYRPKGFQDEEEKGKNEYIKATELKSKALKEIDEIDSRPYTEESLNRRDELIQTVRECNKTINRLSIYKSNRRSNISNINDADELLDLLCDQNSISNNMDRDKRSIKEFLDSKKEHKYKNFMYEESKAKNNINSGELQYAVYPKKASDSFIISNTGIEPDMAEVNYRITIRNSNSLKQEDALSFIKTFQSEALKRNIYIRCKILFEQSDGFIFYVDKNNLLELVKLLEDLKDENVYGNKVSNAINSFGHNQPFSATLGDDCYYSIAMHGVEPEGRLRSTLGGGLISTFNGYMDESLEKIYDKLFSKYESTDRINVDEFYKELITYHRNKMKMEENIPLWMSNRIYSDIHSKGMTR